MPSKRGSRKGFVYVIEAQSGLIKIGFSNNPASRAYTVRQHSPVPVRLIAKWQGQVSDELAEHSRFEAYRSHNEWFHVEGEVAEFVRSVFGRGLDLPPEEFETLLHSATLERKKAYLSRQSILMKAKWADPVRKARWVAALNRRWPKAKSWPEGIDRPASTEAAA